MTARLVAAVLGLVVAGGLFAVDARAEPAKLRIALVSDLDRMEGTGERGGYARLAGVIDGLDNSDRSFMLFHAGDVLSPSLLSGFDKGAHHIDFLNRLPSLVFTPGNHEFDFGPDIARTRLGEAKFPVVSSNVTEPGGGPLTGAATSYSFEVADYKIGVFGLLTPETVQISSPGDLAIEAPMVAAERMAAKLREEGADLVIALVHMTEAEDQELAQSGLVDIVMSGHDHVVAAHYDGRSLLVEAGPQGEQVMLVDLLLDRVEGRSGLRFTWYPTLTTIDTAGVDPSPEMAELVAKYEEGLSKELDIEIGTTEVELDSRRATVRSSEAVIGNLIADAMRKAVGADVALTNGGGIRGDKVYDPGTVLKRRDIQTELPFGNKTVKLQVTGSTILAALENGVSQVEEVAGRFPHVSGMTFEYDLAKVPGTRVKNLKIGGAPVVMEQTYTLATNDYMAKGGDGYDALRSGTSMIDAISARFMASQVIEYIESEGKVAPVVEGRVKRLQ